MKTAMVTGAAGFVGRHLVDELLARGYDVVGIDLKPRPSHRVISDTARYLHIEADCRDWFRDNDNRYDAELVFHCAAQIGGRVGIESYPLYVATDLAIDVAFIQWLTFARGVKNAVYYSSSAVYPINIQSRISQIVLREEHIRLPDSIDMPDMTYGWTKLTGEYLATFIRDFRPELKLHVLRPFSGYGADQDNVYPFPAIMQRARDREPELTVWHDTVRDFIHIDDVVAATFAIIEAGVTHPVNLCTGVPTSFLELASYAARSIHSLGSTPYTPIIKELGDSSKPRGVYYRVGDPTMLKTIYTPKITIQEGVKRAIWTD